MVPRGTGKLRLGRRYLMLLNNSIARRGLAPFAPIALVAAFVPADAASKKPVTVTVYTALQAEQLPVYEQAFEAANPNIQIEWVRDTAANITQRLIDEKADPKADVVWGLNASYLMQVDKAGVLDHYRPSSFELVKDDFKDRRTGWPTCVGMDAWSDAICFNAKKAKEKKLPRPEAWKDLLNPVYKGEIVAPNPSSADTGYLAVAGWLQTF